MCISPKLDSFLTPSNIFTVNIVDTYSSSSFIFHGHFPIVLPIETPFSSYVFILFFYYKILSRAVLSKFFKLHFQIACEGVIESHSDMSNCLWPHGLYRPWNFPGQNTGMDSLSLLQGIFPTRGSNKSLLNCRWILYQLTYQGSQ